MLKVIELFAGIGTQAMALRNIGINYEVVAMSEIDKHAIQSYNAIHGDTPNLGDICKIESLPECDLLTYSFPCQDISNAGKSAGFERGKGTRSGLLWEVERLLLNADHKPKYLLMENVKAIVNKKNMPYFQEWCDVLTSLGYTNYWQILNAKDYGIPQSRPRCFMVSILDEALPYSFPKPQPLILKLQDLLEHVVDEYHFTNGATKWLITDSGKERIAKSYAKIDGEISLCLTARGYYSYTYQYVTDCGRIRRLTAREAWRLMGIQDDDFDKVISIVDNKQLHKQAGNAIVVPVLEAIFKNLFNEME